MSTYDKKLRQAKAARRMNKIKFGDLKIGDRFFLEIAGELREYEKIEPPKIRNHYNMRNVKTGTLGSIGNAAIVGTAPDN